MTYTVKNGTWCKDNNKEYYSTTKTGLKAALAAGEITSGTKVIIHEPQYHTGQLIQSLNPECPEGCFVPHGQAFDTNIYTELAKLFPDGNLPDMRECVMVCAGRSERTEITNHDEYTAGQFKDDQFAEHNHSVSTTVNDPGHGHTVTDPGHDHGRGTYEITGTLLMMRIQVLLVVLLQLEKQLVIKVLMAKVKVKLSISRRLGHGLVGLKK